MIDQFNDISAAARILQGFGTEVFDEDDEMDELRRSERKIAHLAYHLGAIRQINKESRGPKEGTFAADRS